MVYHNSDNCAFGFASGRHPGLAVVRFMFILLFYLDHAA